MAPRALLALVALAALLLLLAPPGCGALPAGNGTLRSRPLLSPHVAAAATDAHRTAAFAAAKPKSTAASRTAAKYAAAAAAPAGNQSLQQLANEWKLTPAQAAAIGKPSMAGRMRICVDPYTPYVFCDPAKPQDTYSGYYVEMFRALAQRVDWLSDFDMWFFDCMDWTPLINDLKATNGTCMMSPAGTAASDDLFASGAGLSWVLDKEGVRILTVPANHDASLWAPLSVFSPALWVLLFCTSMFVGLVLWMFDQRARSLLKPPLEAGAPKQRSAARRRLAALFRGRRGAAAIKGAGREAAGQEGGSGDNSSGCNGGCNGGALGAGAVPPAVPGPDVAFNGTPLAGGGAAGAGAAKGGVQLGKDPLQDLEQQLKEQEQGQQLQQQRSSTRLLRWLGVRQGEEKAAMSDLRLSVTQSVLRLPDIGDGLAAKTLPARIVLFAYGLLLLIIAALYTANAAALLTARLNSDIRSISDLKGKSVGVWEDFLPTARELGITAVGLKWEDENDEQAMLDLLRSGQLKALVLYTSFVDWTISHQCDMAAVGDQFAVGDYGIGFQRNLSPRLRESLDMSLAKMIEEGVIENLYNINVKEKGGGCGGDSSTPADMTQVTPGQVAGLWVLLGLSIAMGVCVLGAYALRRHVKYVHERVQRQASKLISAGMGMARSRSGSGSAGAGGAGAASAGGATV